MTRRRAVLGCLLLLLAACGTNPAPVVEQPALRHTPKVAPLPPGYHQVRRGDTLYSIAFQYGYSYEQVAAWNGIAAPYVIYVGQRLRVMPLEAARPSKMRVLPAAPAAAPMSPPTTQPPPAYRASTAAPAIQEKPPSGPLRWNWPTQGKVFRGFAPGQPGGKGIDIAGRLGQDVIAAANGWVVYSGSGLIGYGQLVIVKHNNSILSAYADNGKILVKEGDAVRAGQVIAAMGENGANGPMLHFEIRRDGKPVNPLDYLPRR